MNSRRIPCAGPVVTYVTLFPCSILPATGVTPLSDMLKAQRARNELGLCSQVCGGGAGKLCSLCCEQLSLLDKLKEVDCSLSELGPVLWHWWEPWHFLWGMSSLGRWPEKEPGRIAQFAELTPSPSPGAGKALLPGVIKSISHRRPIGGRAIFPTHQSENV